MTNQDILMVAPTTAQIDAHEIVLLPSGDRALACRYPSMGGYTSKCWVVFGANSCFEAYVWHDGEFAFGDEHKPTVLHHCNARQFVSFGQLIMGTHTPMDKSLTTKRVVRCSGMGCKNEATHVKLYTGSTQWIAHCDRCADHKQECELVIRIDDSAALAEALIQAVPRSENTIAALENALADVNRELVDAKQEIARLNESLVMAQGEVRT